MSGYESNLWKLYIYRAFGSLAFTTPIFVLYLADKGLSMMEILLLQSIFTIAITLFSIPIGALADRFGRKKMMVISTVLYSAGYFIYYFGDGFVDMAIAEIVFSLSVSMWEGSKSAFIYDTLLALGHEGRFKRYLGNLFMINGISAAVGSLAGAYMADATGNLGTPYLASGIAVAVGLLVLLTLKEPKLEGVRKRSYFKDMLRAIRYTINHPELRLMIVYSSLVGGLIFAAWMLFQPYFDGIGLPVVYFGVVYSVMSIIQAGSAKLAHRIDKTFGEKITIQMLAIIPMICFWLMAFVNGLIGILFPIVIVAIDGLSEPAFSDYLNRHIKSAFRATILSLSLAGWSLASGMLAPAVGFVVDNFGMDSAFISMAFAMLAISSLTLMMRR